MIVDKNPPVLVVDDDMMNIEVLRSMLGDCGVACDFALKGSEALAMI